MGNSRNKVVDVIGYAITQEALHTPFIPFQLHVCHLCCLDFEGRL